MFNALYNSLTKLIAIVNQLQTINFCAKIIFSYKDISSAMTNRQRVFIDFGSKSNDEDSKRYEDFLSLAAKHNLSPSTLAGKIVSDWQDQQIADGALGSKITVNKQINQKDIERLQKLWGVELQVKQLESVTIDS